ncbi:hypothetical protein [Halotia branconii]|uniref:Uncharacterized protein n=1 Tax=Halotia branconii CENA392 TaxID=1539056 RepID=A0AAJ6NYW7_9CYAN|nr:hypothetical protein [Halotia branconii]WGV29135.1 hypothetical protein QI031_30495 [Halotia branconii CENA392]
MNSLRKVLAERYGLVAHIMHDDYFFVSLPDNEDHSLKFLHSSLPECIRVELAECFAGSVIAAWEIPLFLLPQILQQAHDFVAQYWEQMSEET